MSFVGTAKAFLSLVAGELDPHTSQKSITKVNSFNSVSFFTPKHIHFAKYGRGPGKQPPLDEIEKWVSQKGIVKAGQSVRGTAFMIAKSIGEKGTKNYKPGAPDALTEAFEKHMKVYLAGLALDTQKRQAALVKKEAQKALKLNKYK